MLEDVIVVGAGPNGLMLACELALNGVRPLVLERRTGPSGEYRANGLVGQVVRMLDRRGLHARLTGNGAPPRPVPGFPFAAFAVPVGRLPDNPVYTLAVPQARLEQVLAERAAELGVRIRHGVELTGLEQSADRVTALTGDGEQIEARYLVGADGGRSATRKLAGIGFPGVTEDRTVSRTAHVSVPPELVDPATGGLRVPGYGTIPPFLHHRTERGVIAYGAFPGRPPSLTAMDAEPPGDDPVTVAEVRAAAERILGVPLPVGEPAGDGPYLLRRLVGGNTRLADRYRAGRVLLVGDAAHVHSAIGGPGLNLGLQDAVNLGWKLAAEVLGRAPEGLLDTYESERRPVAERVTMHTMAQSVLIGPGEKVTALRRLFADLLRDDHTVRYVADLLAGSSVAYGRWAPDLVVAGTPLAELTRTGRPLLLDFTGSGSAAAAAEPWRDLVDVVTARPGEEAVTAMLLRPDCYVAWESGDAEPDADGLRAALTRWFGAGSLAPA